MCIRWVEPIAAHCTLGRALGVGGFATVHHAVCRATGEPLAVKVLSKRRNPTWRREAEAMAAIQHRAVVPLLAASEDSGSAYLVMPRYQDCDLLDVAQTESLGAERALDYAEQMLEALQAVHSAGLAHLDVKPDNFCVGPDGRIVLMDLGSAAPLSGQPDEMCTVDRGSGTAQYMAPELANDRYNQRTDVWAVGVSVYAMVTGELPYRMSSTPGGPPEYKSMVLSGLCDPLEACIARMLQLDARARPTLTEALALVRAGLLAARPVHTGEPADQPAAAHHHPGVLLSAPT